MGAVRFTERYGEDVDALRRRGARAPAASRAAAAIGVAGTVTTLAALDLRLEQYDRDRVHGHVLTRDAAGAQLSGSPRSPSTSAARCRRWSRSARR